jgi:hypothetical protein
MRQHETSPEGLTSGRIVRFWLPLEATWLMMAAEGPFAAALIARLAAPKENLAAFAVATALSWMVESPIIMMLSASNALVRDGVAYRKLRRFSNALNAAVTLVMIALVTRPVFDLVARGIMGLEPDVARPAGRAMVFLVLWPGAIGFRRFYQGLLIRDGRPQAVTWGTIVRLATMAGTGLFLGLVLRLPGASVGAGALGAGVVAEAAASWVMARRTVHALRRQDDAACAYGQSLTASGIVRFYAPLAATSFLSFFINPLTTFFLARGRMALDSLAVLPVIIGLAFIFRTGGIAVQEVVIALVGDGCENLGLLNRFTQRIGWLSTAGLALFVSTPFAVIWYGAVSGLGREMTSFSILPGVFLVALPFLESRLSFERGLLVKAHRTTPISTAVGIQLAVTIVVFALLVVLLKVRGALTVGPALTAGYAAGVAILAGVRKGVFAGASAPSAASTAMPRAVE